MSIPQRRRTPHGMEPHRKSRHQRARPFVRDRLEKTFQRERGKPFNYPCATFAEKLFRSRGCLRRPPAVDTCSDSNVPAACSSRTCEDDSAALYSLLGDAAPAVGDQFCFRFSRVPDKEADAVSLGRPSTSEFPGFFSDSFLLRLLPLEEDDALPRTGNAGGVCFESRSLTPTAVELLRRSSG